MITSESVLTSGKARHRHVSGFQLDLSQALNTAVSQGATKYTVLETIKHGRKTFSRAVRFKTVYDSAGQSVRLQLNGRPRFAQGGRILISETSQTSATKAHPQSKGLGTAGSSITLIILPGATGVVVN